MPSIKKVKEFLGKKKQNELILLILEMYQNNAEIKNLIDIKIDPSVDEKVYTDFKDKITKMFFPARGDPKYSFSTIRSIIKKYRDISNNNTHVAELMLTTVETGVEFTNNYGDIDEQFYDRIIKIYDTFLIFAKKNDILESFNDKCLNLIEDTDNIGYGFHDEIASMYSEYFDIEN